MSQGKQREISKGCCRAGGGTGRAWGEALSWESCGGWGTTGSTGSIGTKILGLGGTGGLHRGAGTGRARCRALDGNSRAALWGGTGTASEEANRARMPSAATLLTAISH